METENIFGVEVSEDVFTTEFSCDYDVCKGACCYSPLPSGSKVHAVGGGLTKDEYAEVLDRKKERYCAIRCTGDGQKVSSLPYVSVEY